MQSPGQDAYENGQQIRDVVLSHKFSRLVTVTAHNYL